MAPKTGPAILTLKIGGEVGASFKKSITRAQRQMLVFNEKVKRSINDAASGAAKGFKNVIRNDAFSSVCCCCCRFRRSAHGRSQNSG